MNKNIVFPAAALALVLTAVPPLAAQVNAGVTVGPGGIKSFYVAIGTHYRVAPQVVVDYHNRYRLADDELAVVFFLAARAQVSPQVVIDLRPGRRSWLEIALHLKLSPEVFFVPVGLDRIGPPYGNAYGYYRKYGRLGDWRDFRATDREIADLVNLRFMSEYHGRAPEDIIVLRGRGRAFAAIHDDFGKGPGKPGAGRGPKGPSKGKGRGKNK
jgi:hypothetical protein